MVKSGTVAEPKARISFHQFSILVSYLSMMLYNRRRRRDLANKTVGGGRVRGEKFIGPVLLSKSATPLAPFYVL